jgi:hypothetical protein
MQPAENSGSGATPGVDDLRKLVDLIGGYRISQSIFVAVELGIADLLTDGPEVGELAEVTGTHEESRRVLIGVGARIH